MFKIFNQFRKTINKENPSYTNASSEVNVMEKASSGTRVSKYLHNTGGLLKIK